MPHSPIGHWTGWVVLHSENGTVVQGKSQEARRHTLGVTLYGSMAGQKLEVQEECCWTELMRWIGLHGGISQLRGAKIPRGEDGLLMREGNSGGTGLSVLVLMG